MPDSTRHLQEDLLDTPLPEGWRLHEHQDSYYARHPEAGQTNDYDDPEQVSMQAHQLHQQYINEHGEAPDTPTEEDTPETALTQRDEQASRLPSKTVEVFDAESGEIVKRTPEQQRMAMQLVRAIQMSTMVQAVAVARVEGGKHYLDLGHSSFKEFAQTELPYAYRTAKLYLRIGKRFEDLLPQLDASEGATLEALQEQVEESDEVAPFAAMGTRKLRSITTLDDDDFEQLSEEKRLVDPETGDEWTMEELKEMTATDMTSLVEEHQREKRAYMARISQLEEEKKHIESERESDQKMVEDADEKLKKANRLQQQYGPASQRFDDQEEGLSNARSHMHKVRKHIMTFETSEETEQGIKNEVVELVRELNAIVSDVRARHADAIRTADDTIEMDNMGWTPSDDILDKIAATNNGEFDDL